jgi:hypothetical protein
MTTINNPIPAELATQPMTCPPFAPPTEEVMPDSTARPSTPGIPKVSAAELLGTSAGDDLTGAHHRDTVGQRLGFVHVVGGQEDRLAELAQ